MSGSSLDGLDICLATFTESSLWTFILEKTDTRKLPSGLKKKLVNSSHLSGYDLYRLDIEYGEWVGNQLKSFAQGSSGVDIVGFHGHTVFHEPKNKLSVQIGRGSIVSHISGLPVVDDFRTKDILAGGQGAPLVPFGDISLFPEYNAWVNLGGIANCTIKGGHGALAWDIAPCNQVLNYFAKAFNRDYDKDGELAKSGRMNEIWRKNLQSLPYFKAKPPKSMSNQWIQENILSGSLPSPEEGLFTYIEFLSVEMASALTEYLKEGDRILFTGGGAHNHYLMARIKFHLEQKGLFAVVPSSEIVDFKEALIFGFLGLLRKLGIPNNLGSATGATRDSCSGQLNLP